LKKYDLSSAGLHILAMGFMLMDHLWATVVPGNDWMTAVGRLAFPIFAFLIVEGYFHTRSLKKYKQRLLLGAVISEIPFNLMCSGRLFFPIHQNVLWTFLLALMLIQWNERLKDAPPLRRWIRWAASLAIGFLVGTLTMVDYYGYGVMMVLVFYRFRERSWLDMLAQALLLFWINWELMGGLVYPVVNLEIPQQAFALLALIPIWLYGGRKGFDSRWFRRFCYLFYPAHMLLLALLRNLAL